MKKVKNIYQKYKFINVLGVGSQGTVWEAKSIKFDFPCAIKALRKKDILKYDVNIKNFKNELKVLGNVSYPHIVKVYELLHDDVNFYIVMELASKVDLFTYLTDRNTSCGRMTEKEVQLFAIQLFSAL